MSCLNAPRLTRHSVNNSRVRCSSALASRLVITLIMPVPLRTWVRSSARMKSEIWCNNASLRSAAASIRLLMVFNTPTSPKRLISAMAKAGSIGPRQVEPVKRFLSSKGSYPHASKARWPISVWRASSQVIRARLYSDSKSLKRISQMKVPKASIASTSSR